MTLKRLGMAFVLLSVMIASAGMVLLSDAADATPSRSDGVQIMERTSEVNGKISRDFTFNELMEPGGECAGRCTCSWCICAGDEECCDNGCDVCIAVACALQ